MSSSSTLIYKGPCSEVLCLTFQGQELLATQITAVDTLLITCRGTVQLSFNELVKIAYPGDHLLLSKNTTYSIKSLTNAEVYVIKLSSQKL